VQGREPESYNRYEKTIKKQVKGGGQRLKKRPLCLTVLQPLRKKEKAEQEHKRQIRKERGETFGVDEKA